MTGAGWELVTQTMSREGARQQSPKSQWRTGFGETQLVIQLGGDRLIIGLYGQAGEGQILRRPHNDFTVTHNIQAGIAQNRRRWRQGPRPCVA